MKKEVRLLVAGKFLSLFKNDQQYQTPVIRINKNRKNLAFVILFKLDPQSERVYVLNRSQQGYSDQPQRLKIFKKASLYTGMLQVPPKARGTIQILQVDPKDPQLKEGLRYYSQEELALISQGRAGELDVYDPFRYAHSSRFADQEQGADPQSLQEYLGIQGFHPFIQEGEDVLPLSCTYQDPLRRTASRLQLLGWYYLDQQLKISWKPLTTEKSRWRSSLLSIDKKSRRYFFQGNLYQEKGTDPIFLEQLKFQAQETPPEYFRMVEELQTQERQALLRMADLKVIDRD
ncbi:hypothetical protein [Streptococcus danieliae]|uniref:Uncharacterized protein n=1 Tax=Streptococcus danieliae TaxID=747656 RepID=A0A7Z0M7N5_9STRE|nr:hypothetical protein [Streptococcus danieliae]MBF0700229.1 hypothetical protein [Streptococcus danieliae]NYS97405.1 hypothetical protein [Streptococcus danieliae]